MHSFAKKSRGLLESDLIRMNLVPRYFASDPGRVPLSRKRLYILRPDLKLSIINGTNLGIFTCLCDASKGTQFVKVFSIWSHPYFK